MNEHVLIIDDDENIRDMLKIVLEQAGFLVETAPDGMTAKKWINNTAFHVAVVDIILPDINGLDLIDYIRKSSPATRIVVITVSDTPALARECRRRGVAHFMGKPFDLEQFSRTVCTASEESPVPSAEFSQSNY